MEQQKKFVGIRSQVYLHPPHTVYHTNALAVETGVKPLELWWTSFVSTDMEVIWEEAFAGHFEVLLRS
jgi:hypothetical protein